MTAVDTDIDSFIRQQKEKLSNEREILNRPAGNNRKQWSEPVKLSPRGYLDTDAIINDVQKEREKDEYRQRWRDQHGGQEPTPRATNGPARGLNARPINVPASSRALRQQEHNEYRKIWREQNAQRPVEPKMAGGNTGYLDTNSIIREVQREKQEEELKRQGNLRGPIAPPPRVERGGANDNYRQIWEQQQQQDRQERAKKRPVEAKPLDDPFMTLGGGYEEQKKKVTEERHKDYLEFKRSKKNNFIESPRQSKPGGALINDAGRAERLRKMEEERNREYKEIIAQKRGNPGRPSLREQTDDHKASTLLANQSDAAKIERMKERNNEYREFLAQQSQKEQHRFDSKKPPQNGYGAAPEAISLPGLRYSNSAQQRKQAEERNREYNNLMQQKRQRGAPPPVEPKQGWSTPTYEQILERKRGEEQGFRRANDPGFQENYNARETELRIKELDRDLAAKNADTSQFQYGILNDPGWLSPRRSNAGQYVDNPYSIARGSPVGYAASKRSPRPDDGQYLTSLPLGGGHSDLTRKEQYARDLRTQMEETKLARKMERQQGALVNNNSVVYQKDSLAKTPRARNAVEPYHTDVFKQLEEIDRLSPRGTSLPMRRQDTVVRRAEGGLNLGRKPISTGYNASEPPALGIDMSILERPAMSTLDPPAGLLYQPS